MSLNIATRLPLTVLPIFQRTSKTPALSSFFGGACVPIQCRQYPRPLSRRNLATAAAYRPEFLDPTPPPRNTGVPDTSINHDDRGAAAQENSPSGKEASPTQLGGVSEPEGQAQQPRPAPDTNASGTATGSLASGAPTTQSAKPVRKSKLRPRKAAMSLSSKAITQLRDLLQQPDPKLIRVGVKNRGCSGLAYHLEYVDKAGMFDESVEQDGVKVLIDSKALFSIIGSEMDWIEDKLSARFVFRNPNISKFC